MPTWFVDSKHIHRVCVIYFYLSYILRHGETSETLLKIWPQCFTKYGVFCIDYYSIWIFLSQYQMLRKWKRSYRWFESREKINNNIVINRPGFCQDKRGAKFSFKKSDIKVIAIHYIGNRSPIVLNEGNSLHTWFKFLPRCKSFLFKTVNSNSISVNMLTFTIWSST